MRLLSWIAILVVTAAVTFGTPARGQPLEDPNAWVIRVPISAHLEPAEHPATFADEVACQEFLGSEQFAEDFQAFKMYEHIQHAGAVKFGIPKCEQRGDPA